MGLCDKPLRVCFFKKTKHFKEIYNYSEFKKEFRIWKKLELNISMPYVAGCCSDLQLVSALFGMICCPVSYRRCSRAFRRNWSHGAKINISLDFRVIWTLEHLNKGNIDWISLFRTAKAHIFRSADHKIYCFEFFWSSDAKL